MTAASRNLLQLLAIVAVAMVVLVILMNRGGDERVEEDAPVVEESYKFEPRPHEYIEGDATREGIGKYYMNREIAQVMGHPAINWLERPSRENEEAPSAILDALDLAPDAVVADIGAGSGYYSSRLAALIPEGRVVAVDIQPEMLEFLARRMTDEGVGNVEPHLGRIESIDLPPKTLDGVLMVDAYHEFSHPHEMMQSVMHALKPGGRVYLLEYKSGDPTVNIKPLHTMTETQVLSEMEVHGLRHVETVGDLPMQHLLVFEKPVSLTWEAL